jgi:alginate O-acetyltransferase complex protein AlgI
MLFNSLHFLFFLPLVTILYYLLPFRFRWPLIFIASCYFYMAFVPVYILILFLVILIDYVSGVTIETSTGRTRKTWLIVSLLANISLLAFFKYFNFLNENLTAFLSLFGSSIKPLNLSIILPIGLSFHTFQSMSYTIEVYRGRQKAERHPGYFANYVLFFPQMVAGPIERYSHLGEQLRQEHKPVYENFANGFRLILFGLFMKMTVADNIAPYINSIYEDPLAHSASETLLGLVLFSFQIYADFAGYSTIAQGAALWLGIEIMDNFRTPYLSLSVSEFWTRWHISLSTWFRDYLYIPLGGNRVKLPRWVFNIMVVFMVSGLWHGASWTFVAWGALHGLFLLGERLFAYITGYKQTARKRIISFALGLKTFILVTLAWVFFRAESFAKVKVVAASLLSGNWSFRWDGSLSKPLFFTVALVIFDWLLYNTRVDKRLQPMATGFRWSYYTLLIFSLFALSGMQKFQFIYFQF